jgi:hypothetical protein
MDNILQLITLSDKVLGDDFTFASEVSADRISGEHVSKVIAKLQEWIDVFMQQFPKYFS